MLKKARTEKQQALLDYKRAAPIAIPDSREVDVEAAVIQAVHDWIWANRPPYCQLCRGRRRAECGGFPDEMHEEPSRAKTRGLPAWERFNLIICGRLCHACHQDVTEHRLWVVFDNPVAGFMGPVRATTTKVR